MPKGVIWTHDDLRETSLVALRKLGPVPENLDGLIASLKQVGPGGRLLPACPLMHGTGLLRPWHDAGRRLRHHRRHPSFRADEMWKAVEDNKAMTLVIVGDAFAKPMLAALEERTRPLRHLQHRQHGLVRRDVEPRGQAGPAAPHPAGDPGRQFRLVRSGRLRHLDDDQGRRGADREIHDRRPLQGVRRRRPAGRAGNRRDRAVAAARSRSATTRTRRRPPRPSRPSTASATPCPATGAWWRRTAR